MCRWLVYKGAPILIGSLTHEPEHSLVKQSKNGGYYPGCNDPQRLRNLSVNGDGFGLAWYTAGRAERGSCLFRCITPAWNNFNLQNIVLHTTSSLVFAHVRAVHGSYGTASRNNISEDNCHPFVHGRYTFMHNGDVAGFASLKRHLRQALPNALYDSIVGATDSEHAFGVLLDEIGGDLSRELSASELSEAVERMINRITALQKAHGITKGSSLNFAVTDGRHIVCTRCRNNAAEAPPSLYYSVGEGGGNNKKGGGVDSEAWGVGQRTVELPSPSCSSSEEDDGHNRCIVGGCEGGGWGVAVSSEPLTRCTERWALIPSNHMLVVEHMEKDGADFTDFHGVVEELEAHSEKGAAAAGGGGGGGAGPSDQASAAVPHDNAAAVCDGGNNFTPSSRTPVSEAEKQNTHLLATSSSRSDGGRKSHTPPPRVAISVQIRKMNVDDIRDPPRQCALSPLLIQARKDRLA